MAKKSAYKIMQVSWSEILISPEKSLKQIRFSDGTNEWINTKNMLVNIPDNMIGHVCVFARCSVGGAFVIELGNSLPADTSTEVYFLLGEGDRENKYTSFIQTNNHTDFVLNFDTIKALVDTKADKGDLIAVGQRMDNVGQGLDKAKQKLDNVAHGLENVEHGMGNVEHVLGNKADKTELFKKADKVELNKKADKVELNKKADKVELNKKADKVELNKKADKAELNQMAAYFDSNKVDRADFQALKSSVDKIKPPILIEIKKENGTWSVVRGNIKGLKEEDGNISFSIAGSQIRLIKCYTRADSNNHLKKIAKYGCLNGSDSSQSSVFSVTSIIDCVFVAEDPFIGGGLAESRVEASFYGQNHGQITSFYDNTIFFEIIPEE